MTQPQKETENGASNDSFPVFALRIPCSDWQSPDSNKSESQRLNDAGFCHGFVGRSLCPPKRKCGLFSNCPSRSTRSYCPVPHPGAERIRPLESSSCGRDHRDCRWPGSCIPCSVHRSRIPAPASEHSGSAGQW